jgi:hypothetical protein
VKKPSAFTNVTEAIDVARLTGSRLIEVSAELTEDGLGGFVLVPHADPSLVYDSTGTPWHVRVKCHKLPKGDLLGKWELYFEEDEVNA